MNIYKNIFFVSLLIFSVVACNSSEKEADKQADASGEQVEVESTANVELFFQASLDGQFPIVENEIKNKVDVNILDDGNRTALMLAAYNGHVDIVRLLLKNGAKVDNLDLNSRTALMFASSGPFKETVLELLEAGANPNLIDSHENWTALMFAAGEGQLEVLEVLVDAGANPNLLDTDGESALDFAKKNGHVSVVEYLGKL